MRLFEKAFKPPFRIDRYISWVYDSNHNFCFQFQIDIPDDKIQHFEDVLNSVKKPINKLHYTHKNGMIRHGNNDLILIRGWGYLTGTGGLNLPEKEAAEIQDDLAEYILEKLNNKAPYERT